MSNKSYQNPLIERYASEEMSFIFSPYNKILHWRKLWIALAECEKELGLSISKEQLEEMTNNIEPIDFDYAKDMEKNNTASPDNYYRFVGEPNSIRLHSEKIAVGDTEIITLENVRLEEYTTDPKHILTEMVAPKATLTIEGDKLAPTLTLQLFNPTWKREKTRGIATTRQETITRLISPHIVVA